MNIIITIIVSWNPMNKIYKPEEMKWPNAEYMKNNDTLDWL